MIELFDASNLLLQAVRSLCCGSGARQWLRDGISRSSRLTTMIGPRFQDGEQETMSAGLALTYADVPAGAAVVRASFPNPEPPRLSDIFHYPRVTE
jgi:hypothetical protein